MTVTQRNFNLHRTVTYNQATSIGNLESLSTVAKDSIVNAINELTSSTSTIGNLASLTTDDKSSIVNAINEIDANADANTAAIGTLSSLTTATQVSIVAAVNEHDAEIGDVSSLQTTAISDLVGSINSLFGPMVELSCTSNVASLYFAALCCGDNVIQGIETCDDGNQISGDGCNSNCRQEFFNLVDLDGSNGFVAQGIDAFDQSATYISSTDGDFNGDGINDFVISARHGDPGGRAEAGETYVVFGSKGGFPSSFILSSLDGTNGLTINGINAGDRSSIEVDFAGDFNGDGIDDIVIGAYDADPNGTGSGQVYVVFGHKGAFSAAFELSSLDGSNGVIFNGVAAGDNAGITVGSAGDFNDDGIDDIIAGAYLADPAGRADAGEVYVIFGTDIPFASSTVELSTLDGSNGVTFRGIDAGDRLGGSVNKLMDFNGDGIDDVIMGAEFADPNGNSNAGEVYIVYGQEAAFTSPFELSSLNGVNGVILNGIDIDDGIGGNISYAGDFNDDGLSDAIIGAQLADPNGDSSAGEAYVLFGSKSLTSPFDLSGLNGSNGIIFEGVDADDVVGSAVGSLNDFNLDGISDLLFSGRGADPNAVVDSGECYIIFGSKSSFTSPFDLATLDGDNGFYINGINLDDRIGYAVGSADVNGDGLTDAIIGSRRADPNGEDTAGETYVVFGHL